MCQKIRQKIVKEIIKDSLKEFVRKFVKTENYYNPNPRKKNLDGEKNCEKG